MKTSNIQPSTLNVPHNHFRFHFSCLNIANSSRMKYQTCWSCVSKSIFFPGIWSFFHSSYGPTVFFFLVFFKSKFYFFLNSRVKNGLNNYIFHATKCISRIQLTVIHWFIGINGENDCAQKGSYCKSAMCRITFKTILKSRSHSEWHTLSSPNISVYTLHSYIKWTQQQQQTKRICPKMIVC